MPINTTPTASDKDLWEKITATGRALGLTTLALCTLGGIALAIYAKVADEPKGDPTQLFVLGVTLAALCAAFLLIIAINLKDDLTWRNLYLDYLRTRDRTPA